MKPNNEFERALLRHIECGAKIYEMLHISEQKKLICLYLQNIELPTNFEKRLNDAWGTDADIKKNLSAKYLFNRDPSILHERMLEIAIQTLDPLMSDLYNDMYFAWETDRRIANVHENHTQRNLYNYG